MLKEPKFGINQQPPFAAAISVGDEILIKPF